MIFDVSLRVMSWSYKAKGQLWTVPRFDQAKKAVAEFKKKSRVSKANIFCHRCGEEGHYAVLCPSRIKRKKVYNVACFKCKKMGHILYKCPKLKRKPRMRAKEKSCYRCKDIGHLVKDCPELKKEKSVRAEWIARKARERADAEAIRNQLEILSGERKALADSVVIYENEDEDDEKGPSYRITIGGL